MQRNLQHELMDDPGLDPGEHRRALAGLARINRLSSAGRGMWRGVRGVLERKRGASLLDVAVGSGDVLVNVAQRAASDGVGLSLHACDISGEALAATAERAAGAGLTVTAHRCDVVNQGLPLADAAVDVVMCSLFLHHLKEEEVVRVLREMSRVARLGVAVNDLQRTRRGLFAARVVSRVLTRSPVVHVDAVRSVQGAFTIEELCRMAERAGMKGATVEGSWPLRMMLTWRKT